LGSDRKDWRILIHQPTYKRSDVKCFTSTKLTVLNTAQNGRSVLNSSLNPEDEGDRFLYNAAT
jgi:hypothetical protein